MFPKEDDLPRCLLCHGESQPVLRGLFDDRFGAPGLFDIVRCSRCGGEQTWPQPPEEDLTVLYERFYNAGVEPDSAYHGIREWLLASGLYRVWLRLDGDFSFYRRRGRGRLLDVGCNEGRGLSIYAGNGFAVEGLEINVRAATAARSRGFPVHTAPLAQFSPGAPYQVVVLSQVLEHAADPVAMLTQVRRLLAPGGEVWISCPNAASLWRRVFGRSWINWHVPYHLWHFSPGTLKMVLARAGFDLAAVHTCTPALWIAQSLCGRVGARVGRINRVMRSAPVIAALMLGARALPLPLLESANRRLQGDCLLATARPQAA